MVHLFRTVAYSYWEAKDGTATRFSRVRRLSRNHWHRTRVSPNMDKSRLEKINYAGTIVAK